MSRAPRLAATLAVGLLAGLAGAGPASALDVPRFVDEAAVAGIEHRYTGGWEHFVGGGVAAFDCSGDGFPELYFAGGTDPAALYLNRSRPGRPFDFAEVGDTPLDLTGVTGAYPLDVDGDGVQDLIVLRVGGNAVFRGLGGCRFELANEVWRFEPGDEWSTAASAIWEAEARWPTIAIGNYVDRRAPGAPFGTCHDNHLHRPDGEDGWGPRRLLRPGYCALSMLFSDWNRDGVPDLRVSNDRQYYRGGEEQLWRLPPGASPTLYSRAQGWRELKIWGMGIAAQDLTGDGYPEYFLTSMADNKLQTLAREEGFGAVGSELAPAYEDIAFRLGATVHRPYVDGETMPSTAWHAEFADVNNDGFPDLFVAKGNVEGMVDFARRDPNNLLIGGPDLEFVEGAPQAGVVTFARARGAVATDLDLDGLVDLVVVNREAPAEVWRNLGAGGTVPDGPRAMGNWVGLRLEQKGPNRHAIGAWVEVRAGAHVQRREITVGGGHASGRAGWIHLGVGTAERVEVRVQWPDGQWGPWVRAFANHFMLIRRLEERPVYWFPETAPVGGQGAGQVTAVPDEE